jgi:hypothetical protein
LMMFFIASMLVTSTASVFAGPCADDVLRMESRISALLQTGTRGLSAAQSSAARLHRQPTPGSIAAAESRLGTVPAQTGDAIKAMVAAREADRRGDQSACEQALAVAQRLIAR